MICKPIICFFKSNYFLVGETFLVWENKHFWQSGQKVQQRVGCMHKGHCWLRRSHFIGGNSQCPEHFISEDTHFSFLFNTFFFFLNSQCPEHFINEDTYFSFLFNTFFFENSQCPEHFIRECTQNAALAWLTWILCARWIPHILRP